MSRKTLLIVLFVSLAVNLFLVGALAGGLVVGQRLRAQRPPMMRVVQPVWRAGDVLPPEQARAYHEALRGHGPEIRQAMRQARSERADAWRGLAADPFEPAGVKQRLAQIRSEEAAVRGRLEDAIVDFAGGLPPAERRALADSLSQPPRHEMRPHEERR